ncbi:hypothetical protein KGQ34_03885 [Patescibacteria group bacterium]|nr:hypothetical protein [Patescibacteria group bacterium]
MDEEIQKSITLNIDVHDSILVSELLVVDIIIARITIWGMQEKNGMVVSVAEYRKLLGDYMSTDQRIVERLQFLEAFCKNIIKFEIKNYAITKHGTLQASA